MNKKYISYIIIGAVLILGIFGVFSKRFDLTQEKRYTLSESTVKILESVKKPLTQMVHTFRLTRDNANDRDWEVPATAAPVTAPAVARPAQRIALSRG